MEQPGVQRKLTAILAADVAGYSRLMGADEEGTLRTLTAHRAVIDGLIAEHHGRVVGAAGDSVLADFASAVDAVKCAVEIQQALGEKNAEVADARKMEFRIGVNLGDVIVKGDDIFGDGVNVAARLEGIADPGGICISRSTRDQVRDKLPFTLEDMGEHNVKNIARPVRVFRVLLPAVKSVAGEPATAAASALALPDKPSIVVLPFENMSGDPEQEYFSDGIAEDIITDLSKISALFVIARNSAFTYKGKATKVQEICRDLGVRYVLEGSVRKAGNRVRITSQLIDGATGGHLWAERYDRDLTDIFAVQDDVTQKIVAAMAMKLTRDEKRRIAGRGTDNLEAYDCLLRGRELAGRHTKEAIAQARAMHERAIALDPKFAAAHAALAMTECLAYINQWGEAPGEKWQRAHEPAQMAVALDKTEPQAHLVLGIIYMWMNRHDEATAEAERALALEPNLAAAYATLSGVLHYSGRSEEALQSLDTAMRLDPHYPNIYLHFMGQNYFSLGRYEEAIAALKRRLIRNPETDVSRVLIAAAYGHLGRFDEARAEWAEAMRVNPEYSLEHKRKILPYKNPADFERIVDGLRQAGLPETLEQPA